MGFPSLPRIELSDAFMCLYALPAVLWEGLFDFIASHLE
jgi:hypothetical protein